MVMIRLLGYWVIRVSRLKLFIEKTSALRYQRPPVFMENQITPQNQSFFVACSA
jgi:hypothetical protein